MSTALHSQRTAQLLALLGGDGFTAGGGRSFVQGADGYVEHAGSGIWIHADADMVRLVVPAAGDLPAYRLVLGLRDLGPRDAVRVIAVHARAALAGKED